MNHKSATDQCTNLPQIHKPRSAKLTNPQQPRPRKSTHSHKPTNHPRRAHSGNPAPSPPYTRYCSRRCNCACSSIPIHWCGSYRDQVLLRRSDLREWRTRSGSVSFACVSVSYDWDWAWIGRQHRFGLDLSLSGRRIRICLLRKTCFGSEPRKTIFYRRISVPWPPRKD